MTALVLLVTGSRFYDDADTLRRELDAAAQDAYEAGADTLIVRHGACYPLPSKQTGRIPARSADWLTHLWIRKFGPGHPVTIVEQARPADWSAPCRMVCKPGHRRVNGTTTRCPAAGMYRNQAMIVEDPRPDSGLAFLRDNSAGTRHCINEMGKFHIPVQVVPYRNEGETVTR